MGHGFFCRNVILPPVHLPIASFRRTNRRKHNKSPVHPAVNETAVSSGGNLSGQWDEMAVSCLKIH
jgi:hypothetical protein